PSSVFVYEVVSAYGGAKKFYDDVYISSVCPLGFVIQDDKGKEKNYNYYDSRELTEAVTPFVIQSIRKQLEFGIDTQICYCMGTGKNFKYLDKLNKQEKFFERVVPLEHPRFVMQYRNKRLAEYVDKYIRALGEGA
ncbi:MAG: uracil-DNA glycosylase family protein, partial [Calditrichota bacterium]